jgi:hypothetical protein
LTRWHNDGDGGDGGAKKYCGLWTVSTHRFVRGYGIKWKDLVDRAEGEIREQTAAVERGVEWTSQSPSCNVKGSLSYHDWAP